MTNAHQDNHDSPDHKTVSFGFTEVASDEKQGLVQGVFESVAGNYDLMNDLMSGGIHRLWKNTLIDMLKPRSDMRLLDVAGGTGDIAFRFLRAGGGHVTVCDLTEGMVRVGRDRAIDQNILGGVDWSVGDAQRLPLPDNSVDAYTIAFGLRNVTEPQMALAEAFRVLKPGGRFLCLEFSHVVLPVFDKIYDEYSFRLLPHIGSIVAGDKESYVYLVESIRRFPPQKKLEAMMRDAGFDMVSHRNLSGGIAAIHSGWRI
ncbi:bifunctional demethylmenaquinone methyltransferase/2-methoxy-6-polyprenyl-1,4-benzoquinol methylase UbiE [Aestuariispira insulae]|nr:bifunctional demethylmenaquinone methyltransferase/2-methoxy-6-polyprenyl-1,4-benzoquinol methylase UbiE [Aestuariispira insulae]